MRILIFHGYLLGGTGSNVYNARLAAALAGLGHEVHLLSQDPHPEAHTFVDAVGEWGPAGLQVRDVGEGASGAAASGHAASGAAASGSAASAGARAGRCTVYRPDIGPLLPVYVLDRYEGIDARTFAECSEAEVAHYIDRNVAAVVELVELVRPELALANHLVMGPVILKRALAGSGIPYAVKIHGSALEYTVKPESARFLPLAREGLAEASGILVGSLHTAESLWATLEDPEVVERTRLGPPGVDVASFRPAAAGEDPQEALAGLAKSLRASAQASSEASAQGAHSDAESPAAEQPSAFARDERFAATAIERLKGEDRLVAFVGKLIVSKGVDLLIAAWPLVLQREPRARLVVVGFGAYREGLERLLGALAAGEVEQAIGIARAGRALESDPHAELGGQAGGDDRASGEQAGEEQQPGELPLRHLSAFLEGLSGERRASYLDAARGLRESVVLTGRLEHEELTQLLPACEALVVPSTFPEAFGMVAAEAAACGVLPVSAAHSGLAEVSERLADAVPDQVAPWLSFPVDDHAVEALAERLSSWLAADPALRREARAGLVRTVRERWSWEGVALGVIAAARGELADLPKP